MRQQSKKVLKEILFVMVLLGTAGVLLFNSPAWAQHQHVIVLADIANIHSTPEKSSTIIDTLKAGDGVRFLQTDGDWIAVMLTDRRLGWVNQAAFEKKEAPSKPAAPQIDPAPEVKAKARVAVTSARVRETPSLKADVHFGLKKGSVVTILEEKAGWWHIRTTDGKTGWSSSRLFKRLQDAKPEPSPTPQKQLETPPEPAENVSGSPSGKGEQESSFFQAVLNVASGRVRKGPSLKSAILFKLKKDERVTVIETKGDWFQVLLDDGRTGWAHHRLFTPILNRELRDIRFAVLPGGNETITFALNNFNPPNTFATDDNEVPKIVCDFLSTRPAESIESVFPVDGKMVKRIRMGVHKDASMKVRVVMELDPEKKYNVEQVFFKKKNEYVLTVKPLAE